MSSPEARGSADSPAANWGAVGVPPRRAARAAKLQPGPNWPLRSRRFQDHGGEKLKDSVCKKLPGASFMGQISSPPTKSGDEDK